MKRARSSPEPTEASVSSVEETPKCERIECGICFEPLNAPTVTSCCQQLIHGPCRKRCGPSCPFCRRTPPKEWFFVETLIRVEADHSSAAYEQTVSFIASIKRHLDTVQHDPVHACYHCLTFSRAQLILSTRINRDPANRAVLQAALDRLTAVMPIAR